MGVSVAVLGVARQEGRRESSDSRRPFIYSGVMRRTRAHRGLIVRTESDRHGVDDGDEITYTTGGRADFDGRTRKPSAYLQVRRSVLPKRWFRVERAMVDFSKRRKGLMTRLYEVAAGDACAEGRRLVSDVERSAFSEKMWRTLRRRGHARCFISNSDRRSNAWDGPLLDLEEKLAWQYRDKEYGEPDYDRAQVEMKKLLRDLPKPRHAGRDTYWPCFRWGLKRSLCKQPGLMSLKSWAR